MERGFNQHTDVRAYKQRGVIYSHTKHSSNNRASSLMVRLGFLASHTAPTAFRPTPSAEPRASRFWLNDLV
jgi:hypothetical protein